MKVIDENGNLFGRINVVDLFALLVVLLAVAGGIALLDDERQKTTGSDQMSATLNVTLDLSVQSTSVARVIDVGDSYSPTADSTMTVTDVIYTPVDGAARVLVRVRLTGEKAGETITYDGSPPRIGRDLQLSTSDYDVKGTILTVGGNETLRRQNVTFVVGDRVSAVEAAEIDRGDQITVAGSSMGTVRNVTLQPTASNDERIVYLTVEAEAFLNGQQPQFAGADIDVGEKVKFTTSDFSISGRIQQLGNGHIQTREAVLVVRQVVDRETVGMYAPGSEIRVGNTTSLTIQNRTLQPTDEPDEFIAYLTVNLTTVRQNGELLFAGKQLERGKSLVAVGDERRINGEIEQVGQRQSTIQDTIVLESTLPSDRAGKLANADNVTVAGETVATVRNATVYDVEGTSERRVYLGLTVEAVDGDRGPRFAGIPLRSGERLSFDTGEYRVSGRIARVGGGLSVSETPVLLETTVDTDTASRLSRGDHVRIGNSSVATVQNVSIYGTENPDRKRVLVGLTLETVNHGQRPRFGDTTVSTGRTLSLEMETYELTGTIKRVGTTEPLGTPETRRVTLRMTEVPSYIAQSIEVGMTEQSRGDVLARLVNVSRRPTTVLIRGENGTVESFDHPSLRNVTVTAELQVRDVDYGITFKGNTVQRGQTVTLNLGEITITATVVRVES